MTAMIVDEVPQQVDTIGPRTANGHEFMPKIDDFLQDAAAEPAPAPATPPLEADIFTPPPASPTPPTRRAAPVAVREPPADVQPALEQSAAPEPGAAPEVVPPEVGKNPQANHAWETLRKEAKRAKELEAELLTLKQTKRPELEELAALKTQVQEYEAKIGQIDLRESKQFKTSYDDRLRGMFERGVHLATRAGVEPAQAVQLMQNLVEDGKTVDDVQAALSELPLPVQGSLFNMVTDFSDLRTEREKALTEWQETKARMTDTEQRSSIADMSKQIVGDTNSAIEQLRAEDNFLFMESQTDQAWNGEVQDRIRAVRAILRDSPREELVKYVADGVTAPQYRSLYQKSLAKIEKLQAELNARVGLRPDVTGRPVAEAPVGVRKAPRSPEQVLESEFPEGGSTMRW